MALGPTAYSRYAAGFKPVVNPKKQVSWGGLSRLGRGPTRAAQQVNPAAFRAGISSTPGNVGHSQPSGTGVAGVINPVPPPPAPPVDPRDGTYFTDLAGIRAYYASHLGDLQGQRDEGNSETQKALARLLQRKPEDIRDTRDAFNSRGLYYSGALSRKTGDIERNYAQRQVDINDAANYRNGQIGRGIADLNAFYGKGGIKDSEAMNNAVSRQLQTDQTQGVPYTQPNIPSAQQLAQQLATMIPQAQSAPGSGPGGSAPARSRKPKAPAFNPHSRVFNAMTMFRGRR